jgi:phosphonate transport system ATP-binding protein
MLEIRTLRVVYPNGFEAIKSVSLTVHDGEIVALIGRSGAGKSSLLRCINGLQPIAEGSVCLDGVNVSRQSARGLADLRRRIGFIWQEYNVVERLSVMDNVLTGRLGHQRDWRSLIHFFDRHQRAIAVRSLERVNLLHRATQRADRLSGGEKQRVSIARALAQQPRLILADEPVASLDRELSWQVMHDLVSVSRDEGVPTLVTIHDVDLAREFADRIVGIAHGQVVFDGPPADLDTRAMDAIYRGS